MLALRMKPMVVNGLYVTSLFQSGKLLVNSVDDVVVVANDAQLTCWEVYLVEGKAVNAQLLNLTIQWQFTPHEIAALATANAAECGLGRSHFNVKGYFAYRF